MGDKYALGFNACYGWAMVGNYAWADIVHFLYIIVYGTLKGGYHADFIQSFMLYLD